MSIDIYEMALVAIIILIQSGVFYYTVRQVLLFKSVIPDTFYLSVVKQRIPLIELEQLPPSELLKKLLERSTNGDDLFIMSADSSREVTIVKNTAAFNKIFEIIIYSVNTYLLRNRESSADFSLIKDIVERNLNALEEDINLTLSVPLYLGLTGTMIGIVIGLFNMPGLGGLLGQSNNDKLLSDGITLLIGGVKIAMIGSFFGLLLTIIVSAWIFKGSRLKVENLKNDLYTFLQIELLPVVNHGMAATFDSLQRNLNRFNTQFSNNLLKLAAIYQSNEKALDSQKELLDKIAKADIIRMAKYNMDVLQKLNDSIVHFDRFNGNMGGINKFIENTVQLMAKSNELLERTGNFKAIADNIDYTVASGKDMLEFVSGHIKHLDDFKNLTANKVIEVGFSMSKTFEELGDHIVKTSSEVKTFTIEELDALKKALSERHIPSEPQFKELEQSIKMLLQFQTAAGDQQKLFSMQLAVLAENVNLLTNAMQKEKKLPWFKQFWMYIKKTI